MSEPTLAPPRGGLTGLVAPFLEGRLAILFMIIAAGLGALALWATPQEEDPQIVVPLADVFVQAPGASAEEVERLVATPLERLLWQIDGVEHVYSLSRPGMAVVTVRFFVGEDRERSLVKLQNKIAMNQDQAPPLVRGWVVKPVEIDDVPILALTLHAAELDDHVLRRTGEELLARLAEVPDISRVSLHGGRPREVRVELDLERLAGFGLSPLMVRRALAGADASLAAGQIDRANRSLAVTSDSFLPDARAVGELVVGAHEGRPVYLRDLAAVLDGPAEPACHSRLSFSRQYLVATGQDPAAFSRPAVTLALAKKKGTNAASVSRAVLARLEELKPTVLPAGVAVTVTRDSGATAHHKSNELIEELVMAVITVVALLAFTLGWREALVVALAVPLSFACALFVNYLFGYTINRVTMFALILSLGLVVDDPIINVDNIQRHILAGRESAKHATLRAVNEVLPPVIMSTLAIVVSFAPMFYITGMMGPYMAPMAANVPLTVGFSLLWALTVVPWLSYLLLRRRAGAGEGGGGEGHAAAASPGTARAYRALVLPLLRSRGLRWLLFAGILAGLAGCAALVLMRQVPLKMLPFDNKNEFQIVLDFPEGTPLEATDRALRDFEAFLAGVPEVTSYVTYAGAGSPMDFNGLVRHYYLRQGGHLADIRVNLVPKEERQAQSHALCLRLRSGLQELARRHGARLKLVELPPGPPVMATLVAEIEGEPGVAYAELLAGAERVASLLGEEPQVVDVATSAEAAHPKLDFVVDKEKAALHGVSTHEITATLRLLVGGDAPATVHAQGERQTLAVRLVLPREKRSHPASLAQAPVTTQTGQTVPLAELGRFEQRPAEQPILHRDLKPVAWVTAEVAGRPPALAVLDAKSRLAREPLPAGIAAFWDREGEWQITLQVFRDLGLAFGAALVGIYVLLVIETASFLLPLLLMVAIPLTVLGILPGFWLLNLLGTGQVGGYPDPVFFTATSMIGMIALGGIVIRNSVVLIDFIKDAVREGVELRQAILQSGAVRFRPIALTAASTLLGAWPITLDPIFSGLAWALIFGLFASTAFSLVVVPVAYYALYGRRVPGGE